MKKITIFDTSLRDGSQAPGCGMHAKEKFEYAKLLSAAGIDVIEAGFHSSSRGEFKSFEQIAKYFAKSNTTICSFSRLIEKDIFLSWQSLKFAKKRRIHLGIATSDRHLKTKLFMNQSEVLLRVKKLVEYANKFKWEIQFYAEDATRTNVKFLQQVFKVAFKAGARHFLIPDTVGISSVNEYKKTFLSLKKFFKNEKKITLGAHCHDDLGLAVSNSLAAIEGGAREIQGTFLGIGERSGNAALEEVILNLNENLDYKFNYRHNVKSHALYKLCSNLSKIINIEIPINKTLVGRNSFATEAGIHVDGSTKNKKNYLAFKPEKYDRKEEFVLGARSGKATLKIKLQELKIEIKNDEWFNTLFFIVKNFCDKNIKTRGISNKDLLLLIKKIK